MQSENNQFILNNLYFTILYFFSWPVGDRDHFFSHFDRNLFAGIQFEWISAEKLNELMLTKSIWTKCAHKFAADCIETVYRTRWDFKKNYLQFYSVEERDDLYFIVEWLIFIYCKMVNALMLAKIGSFHCRAGPHWCEGKPKRYKIREYSSLSRTFDMSELLRSAIYRNSPENPRTSYFTLYSLSIATRNCFKKRIFLINNNKIEQQNGIHVVNKPEMWRFAYSVMIFVY